MLSADDELSLLIEKPAAGGRMIARHEGQIVFVAGAIPGERVRVRVEQVRGGTAYAATTLRRGGVPRPARASLPIPHAAATSLPMSRTRGSCS